MKNPDPKTMMLRFLLTRTGWVGVWCGALLLCCSPPSKPGPGVTISPKSGEVSAGTLVRLTSQASAKIYYTLDDTKPDPLRSLLYREPFRLWGTATLRVVAIDPEGHRGPESKAAYRVDNLFPQTKATPPGGNYRGVLTVELQSDEVGQIRYTTDGTEPTLRSRAYTEPLLLDGDTTLKFFGVDKAGNREPVQTQVYNFPPALTILPRTGLFLKRPIAMEIKSDDPSAKVMYTVVERLQKPSQVYKKPVTFAYDTLVQVRAEDNKGWSSKVQTRLYAFLQPLKLSTLLTKPLDVLVAAAVDLEGLDQPGLVMVTKDTLYVTAAKNGALQPLISLASLGFEATWMRSWDLDGDGLNDILLGDKQRKLHVYRATSGRSLEKDTALLSMLRGEVVRVVPLDYNKDGQLDLFVLDHRKGESRLVQRTSSGYKVQPPLSWTVEAGASDALAGDFNNDGITDLLLLPGNQRAPYLLLGDGKGNFKQLLLQAFFPETLVPKSMKWLHAARSDMDGDGDLDLVLLGRAMPAEGKVARLYVLLMQHLDGPYWKVVDIVTLPDASVRGCDLADLNSDGYPDWVMWHSDRSTTLLHNFLGQRLLPLTSQHLPQSLPPVRAGVVSFQKEQGAHALWWSRQMAWDKLAPQPKDSKAKATFFHLLLQGYRGNRNAIDTKVQIETEKRSWLRQIGVRSTGPDQSSLFLPIPFDNKTTPTSVKILWSDGLVRDLPNPPKNKPTVVRPN